MRSVMCLFRLGGGGDDTRGAGVAAAETRMARARWLLRRIHEAGVVEW